MPKVIEDLEFRLSGGRWSDPAVLRTVHPLRLPPGWIPGLP